MNWSLVNYALPVQEPKEFFDKAQHCLLYTSEAIPDLPRESEISTADKGRVSKGAAQAFLSRVALYEGCLLYTSRCV